jgi:hypothetical protein
VTELVYPGVNFAAVLAFFRSMQAERHMAVEFVSWDQLSASNIGAGNWDARAVTVRVVVHLTDRTRPAAVLVHVLAEGFEAIDPHGNVFIVC